MGISGLGKFAIFGKLFCHSALYLGHLNRFINERAKGGAHKIPAGFVDLVVEL